MWLLHLQYSDIVLPQIHAHLRTPHIPSQNPHLQAHNKVLPDSSFPRFWILYLCPHVHSASSHLPSHNSYLQQFDLPLHADTYMPDFPVVKLMSGQLLPFLQFQYIQSHSLLQFSLLLFDKLPKASALHCWYKLPMLSQIL